MVQRFKVDSPRVLQIFYVLLLFFSRGAVCNAFSASRRGPFLGPTLSRLTTHCEIITRKYAAALAHLCPQCIRTRCKLTFNREVVMRSSFSFFKKLRYIEHRIGNALPQFFKFPHLRTEFQGKLTHLFLSVEILSGDRYLLVASSFNVN